jgi:hypothetical protein
MLTVVILLAAKHDMSLLDRQLALFRLVDFNQQQTLSGEGMVS